MSLAPRSWGFTAVLGLAFATIFIHALVPSGSPLRKSSGSAFNPFTSEVALSSKGIAAASDDKREQGVSNAGGGEDAGGIFSLAALALAAVSARRAPPPRAFALPMPKLAGGLVPRAFRARAPPLA